VGNAHDLAVVLLVGLEPADGDQQPGGLVVEADEGERDQLGSAQRAGVAEQDDRGIADTDRAGLIDVPDHLPELGHTQRACLRWGRRRRCGADLANRLIRDRVGHTTTAVLVPDG
jgi:hypothetical protein